jgi:hypothetical protein
LNCAPLQRPRLALPHGPTAGRSPLDLARWKDRARHPDVNSLLAVHDLVTAKSAATLISE